MSAPTEAAEWGWYGCLSWEPEVLHPDDRPRRDELLRRGDVCERAGTDGDHAVLWFGTFRVRIRADLLVFRPVAAPVFRHGDWVRTRPPRTARVGRVRAIVWHANRRVPMFFLEGPGTRRKNRYVAEELERATEA